MIVPGAPSDPIQIIDVRDVADFIVHCLEERITGVYNVTGPAKPLSMKAMVEEVHTGTHSQVDFTWIDNDFLGSHGVQDDQFPLYVPPTGESAGLHRCKCSRALARGLTFRPLTETSSTCLEWYRTLPVNIQKAIAPQFAERPGHEPWLKTEKHVLDAWNERQKK